MADPERGEISEAAQEAFDAGSREYVQGNEKAAIRHFTRAIELHADFDSAGYMLGLAQARVGAQEEAVEILKKVADTTSNLILREYALRKLAGIDEATS